MTKTIMDVGPDVVPSPTTENTLWSVTRVKYNSLVSASGVT